MSTRKVTPTEENLNIANIVILQQQQQLNPDRASSVGSAKDNFDDYFKTRRHKRNDVPETLESDEGDKSCRIRCKNKIVRHLRIFIAVFSRKMFLRHRSIVTTIVEVLLSPLIVVGILAVFTNGISWDKASRERDLYDEADLRFPETEVEAMKTHFRTKYCDASGKIFLIYYPDTTLVRKILGEVLNEFDIETHNKFHTSAEEGCDVTQRICEKTGMIAVKSTDELLEMALLHRKDRRKHKEPIGVIFEYNGWKKDHDPDPVIPKTLTYRIRLFHEELSATTEDFPYVEQARTKHKISPYVESGYLGLQYAIEEAYLTLVDNAVMAELAGNSSGKLEGSSGLNAPKLRNFPVADQDQLNYWPLRIFKMYHYPNFFSLPLRKLIVEVICFTCTVSYAAFTYFIVKQVVTENEAGIKDLLKMHNMPMILHWIILLLHTLLLRLITSILIVIFLFISYGNGAIMVKSNYFLVFLFIYSHMLCLSSFNFFLSTIFDNVSLSGIYAIIIGLSGYFIPLGFQTIGLLKGYVANFVTCLLCPNWAFVNGITQIIEFEVEEKGLTIQNITDSANIDYLGMAKVLCILFVTSVVYFVIAVIRDITKQKRLSPGYKWYQFRKALREKRLQKKDHEDFVKDKDKLLDDFEKPEIYEGPRPFENRSIVHVRHVSVSAGKNKKILDTLSLNFYNSEITVLLGHTGSGKSSLIQIIAGMLTPNHGYATICGYDINYDKRNARKYVGFAPQKVILFNLLTVFEHLTTCYRLRGFGFVAAKRHANSLITLTRLSEARSRLPSELTDENRRKLSIALALVDAPRVILLDEPTYSLDSVSRREIWSVIVTLRKHHTIIIGTNRMDEAEYLADRIGLISHGKLVCYGTPAYLKRAYDTGYFLKIVPQDDSFNVTATSEIIKNHLDDYPKEEENGGRKEIFLEIPKNKIPRYPAMLDELDSKKSTLGIKSYYISQVSLYDIFIKICDAIALGDEAPDKSFRRNQTDTRRQAFDDMELPDEIKHETFTSSKGKSVIALFKKQLIYMKSKSQFFLWEFLIPLILIGIICWSARVFEEPVLHPPAKELTLRKYPKSQVFYRLGTTDVPMNLGRDYNKKIQEILRSNGAQLLNTEQVLVKLEEEGSTKDGYQQEKHLIGLEFRQLTRMERGAYKEKLRKETYLQFVGYYSSGALHSPPIVMNLVSNVMLSAMFPFEKSVRKIHGVSEPFPTKFTSDVVEHCDAPCLLFAVTLSLALSFYVAGRIVFPKYERHTGMKQLQLMTGLHPVIYWGVHYVCDLVVSLLFGSLVSLLFVMGSDRPFNSFVTKPGPIGSLALIILLYLTWSSIPFAYFLSAILPEKVGGYVLYILIHAIFGWFPVLTLELNNYRTKHPSNVLIFLRNFMHIFPMYTITSSLHRWFEIDATRSLCATLPKTVQKVCELTKKHGDHHATARINLYSYILTNDLDFAKCCDRICKSAKVKSKNKCFRVIDYFDWGRESFEKPLLIQCVIVLAVQGLFYWGLLIFMERGILTNVVHNAVLKFIRTHSKGTKESRPPEVEAEEAKCEAYVARDIIPEDVALICLNLKKSYATVMVVNNVSMAVKKGECFGLLGGGGSGKSVLIQLLCGQTLATTGEVFIGDSSIHHHRVQFLKKIGYCPQNFCFFDMFTTRQMLELMGRLRGIPTSKLKNHVDQWLLTFGLTSAGNSKCKKLTRGMQRCLCVALSLIGGCEVILMDEPTSSIDPNSRYRIWSVMSLLSKYGRTIIYSTYNCEECTFLSTRMIVLCEGNVQCMGPPMELINKFSKGFTILIRVRHDILSPLEIMSATMGRVVKLKQCMKHKFKHLTLRDEQDNLLLYFLRDTKILLADIFRRLEQVREENEDIIEKYYVSEATLEDVFVLLTNKYREMDAPRRMEPAFPGTKTQKEAEKAALRNALKKTELNV